MPNELKNASIIELLEAINRQNRFLGQFVFSGKHLLTVQAIRPTREGGVLSLSSGLLISTNPLSQGIYLIGLAPSIDSGTFYARYSIDSTIVPIGSKFNFLSSIMPQLVILNENDIISIETNTSSTLNFYWSKLFTNS